VADSDRFTSGSIINAFTVYGQTLVSCLKHTALDRLRVRLNVYIVIFLYWLPL